MGSKDFAVDVAKYFMDFLETNFHKRKAPKRVYKSKNQKNLLTGINLKRFPEFRAEILKLASKNFNNLEVNLKKGKHTKKISAIILELVIKYSESLKQEQLDLLSDDINQRAKELIREFSFNVDEAKNRIIEISQDAICKTFITPLVEKISNPLQAKHLYEEEYLLGMESELCSLFSEVLEGYIADFAVSNIVEENKSNLDIKSVISLEKLKSEIKSYFESLKIEDLFFEVSELLNNRQIIDKQELYIYLFDIRLDQSIYPLFYVPVEAEKESENIRFKLDSSIYINKKAVEYLTQKINEAENRQGKIASASNRIIYINENQESVGSKIENIFNDLLNYSHIDGNFQIDRFSDQVFKSKSMSLTNNCYFGLFDKSDESLINDYEELIGLLSNDGDSLGEKFCSLLEGFLKEEPIRILSEVEKEWDDTEASEKLVTISPIPLNDEQNQIIRALKKKAKYITVEGPPGTGKSHTITAIVFNAILEGKNTLVLSDKKEALDVVEDKIINTLNSVRLSNDFQNPILRLGKSGNTYNQILSTSSITNIKMHYKAVEKHKGTLRDNIEKIQNKLKDKIEDEITEYSGINLSEIIELEKLESKLKGTNLLKIDESELYQENDVISELESIYSIGADFNYIFSPDGPKILNDFYYDFIDNTQDFSSFTLFNNFIKCARAVVESGLNLEAYRRINGISSNNIPKLISISARLEEMGSGFFGYLFKGSQLSSLLSEFQDVFNSPEIVNLKKEKELLKDAIAVARLFEEQTLSLNATLLKYDKHDFLKTFLEQGLVNEVEHVTEVNNDLIEVEQFIEEFPETSKNLNLKSSFDANLFNYASLESSEFEQITYYYRIKRKVTMSFNNLPRYDYVRNKKTLEDLYTTQMTHVLDGRVLDFFDNHASTAKTLKNIISSKKRFPKEEFKYLKEAFPCIISGIRDYAEYIPLADELFDIVIIDEASQVSIAQTLPALLRAKKVVVFGDKKQFSNIKSAQARSEINRQYIKTIKDNYLSKSSIGESELERLAKFDIKTSVLDFFEYIGNYGIMLKKHFRGYKELISYSSKNFYNNDLQAIKIRGKNIEEVLEFKFLEHDGKLDTIENTNSLEVNEVIKYLECYIDKDDPPSIGVITPHTNQQKILLEAVTKHPRYEDFCKKNHLKIMTFDTCQGEERDHIVYSMVAHIQSDKLNYIFIKDLKSVDVDEDNKIKAQRLNVGFSRAKEKMVFILSKALDDYTGAIGDALRHYYFVLNKSKSIPLPKDVDKNSPMEVKVLEWIQETSFFKSNMVDIELKAQFPVGDYLKQLDPTYKHPSFVCDFLLLFRDENGKFHSIIIEYDGFKEHFVDLKNVNEFNFEQYYNDEDVYREKVLEGYGYKFLRINRFNIGLDPIDSLDKRLKSLVKVSSGNTGSTFIAGIHNVISELEQGNLKECLKCHKLLPLVDFQDAALSSGIGRYCNGCKTKTPKRRRERINRDKTPSYSLVSEKCPKCNSSMVKRSGKYGSFLGCSKFPRCKGTKNISPQNLPSEDKIELNINKQNSGTTDALFNQTDEYWNGRYQDCIQFYKNNGKWPSGKSLDKNERSLYYWAKQQRRRFEAGNLGKEQSKLLVEVNKFLNGGRI